jgi:hypothetical protein
MSVDRFVAAGALAAAFAAGFLAGRLGTRPAPAASASPAAPAAAPEVGLWAKARPAPDARQPAAPAPGAAELRALPYLAGYEPAPAATGVRRHVPSRAFPGLNLYVSGHGPEAVLMDMKGRVRHRWRQPLRRALPQLAADSRHHKLDFFQHARLLPNGDLLGVFDGLGLVKLDRDSRLLWAYAGGIHHDLDLGPEGEIYALERIGGQVPEVSRDHAVLEDFVAILSPDGRLRRRVSILRALLDSPYAPLVRDAPDEPDMMHTNTLELLDGRHAARLPAFRAGNVLVSIPKMDAVAVLDLDAGRVVWALKGMWRRQHQPSLLPSGHLLVFDNLGAGSASRVLEIDPLTQRVAWSYGGRPEDGFFTRNLGSCHRLPNGNTLIVESKNGRAFEVTAAGETVWEWVSPERAGERGELVAALFDMERLAADHPFGAVARRGGGAAAADQP